MPTDKMINDPNRKPLAAFVLRVGSHPVVYSVLTIVAVGALVFFLAIVPFVHALQAGGKASIADAQNRNRAAQNTLAGQKKLVDTAASLTTKDRANLSYALPADQDTPGLAIIFNSITRRSGVKLSSLDIAEAADGGSGEDAIKSVGKMRVTVAADQVTYEKLKILLTNIEQSLRLFDIHGLAFSPSTGSANLQLETYYLTKP